MWRPRAAFSSGAVEAHPTLEYQKIKGDKTYVEASGQLPSMPSPKSGPGPKGALQLNLRTAVVRENGSKRKCFQWINMFEIDKYWHLQYNYEWFAQKKRRERKKEMKVLVTHD